MGYNTQFEGVLKFKKPLSEFELLFIKTILGEDTRDHPDWKKSNIDASYIQLELTKDKSGIQYDGSEKFYNSVEAVNLVTMVMRDKFPDFCLEGSLIAQGEAVSDRWSLIINEWGLASRVDIQIKGQKIQCPHCEDYFYLEIEE